MEAGFIWVYLGAVGLVVVGIWRLSVNRTHAKL